MRTHLIALFLLGMTSAVCAQEKITFDILFKTGDATLDKKDKRLIDEAFQLQAPDDFYTVHIVGHTDAQGENADNQLLSEQRAQAVLDYVKSTGFTGTDIETSGKGETELLPGQKASKNRRVEVIIERPMDHFTSEELFQGLDGNAMKRSINADKGGSFEYESGTVVNIPEAAFVDADGQPVTGAVNISYREFRDPVDIMFSQIPMTHSENGKDYYMQSGGMFEIQASQNGQPLQLAPGKNVDIDFVTTPGAEEYDFWKADGDGHWDNANNMVLVNDVPVGLRMDSMIIDFDAWLRERNNSNIRYVERESELSRVLAIQTALQQYDPEINGTVRSFVRKTIKKPDYEFSGSTRVHLQNYLADPQFFNVEVATAEDDSSNRHILLNFKDQNGDNLDLKPFEDSWFRVRNDEFLQALKGDPTIADLRLRYDSDRDKFTLKIKDEGGEHKYEATRVAEQGVGASQSKARNKRLYKEYRQGYNERLKMIQAIEVMSRNKGTQPYLMDAGTFWKASKAFMTDRELAMSEKEWLHYFANNPKLMYTRYSNLEQETLDGWNNFVDEMQSDSTVTTVVYDAPKENTSGDSLLNRPDLTIDFRDRNKYDAAMAELQAVIDGISPGYARSYLNRQYAQAMLIMNPALVRSVRIDGMGQWNCDQLGRFQEPERILASYQDANGQEISAVYMSMLFMNENSALSQDPYAFTIDKVSEVHFVIIDRDGDYWVLKSDQFKAAEPDDDGQFLFTLTDVTEQVDGATDLKRILGIGS